MEADLRNTYVEAMTVKDPPVLQAARLDDYSPEYWAVTAANSDDPKSKYRSDPSVPNSTKDALLKLYKMIHNLEQQPNNTELLKTLFEYLVNLAQDPKTNSDPAIQAFFDSFKSGQNGEKFGSMLADILIELEFGQNFTMTAEISRRRKSTRKHSLQPFSGRWAAFRVHFYLTCPSDWPSGRSTWIHLQEATLTAQRSTSKDLWTLLTTARVTRSGGTMCREP